MGKRRASEIGIRGSTSKTAAAVLVLLFISGVLLRVASAMDCFWLDEIWSYFIAMSVSHPWEIVTKVEVNNNHPLNTLFIYLIGDTPNWIWYRVPAMVTGSLAPILVWKAASEYGAFEGVAAAGLTAISYPLVLYSSEARGYAPAIFFALISFFLLHDYFRSKSPGSLSLFRIAAILGLLSNLSFGLVYMAIIFWSMAHEAQHNKRDKDALLNLVRYHAIPTLVLIYLVVIYLSINAKTGEAGARDPVFIARFFKTAGSAVTGAPQDGPILAVAATLFLVLIFAGLQRIYRADKQLALFFLLAIFLPPVLGNLISKLLYFRFTIVSLPFAFIALALGVCGFLSGSALKRAAAVLFIAVFVYGNCARIYGLIKTGRGDYLGAVMYMARHTGHKERPKPHGILLNGKTDGQTSEGDWITVAGDHDFRNMTVLKFYARYLPPGKKLVYVLHDRWLKEGSDWLLFHTQYTGVTPPPIYKLNNYDVYALEKIFPYSGMSGWNWFLYRRIDTRAYVP